MAMRRLAAVAVLDVVGFSRMMAEDEDGTLATLKAHRNDIDAVLLNRGGRIVKGTGDGLLVEFPSSVEAVAAALEVQQLMAGRNEALPEPRRMMLRIGINAGDVLVDDDGDIYGDAVNIAARLEPQADPMGVCVSGVVHDQSLGRLPAEFESLGSLTVKNIPHPVEAWRVRPEVSERQLPQAGVRSSYERFSLAVLPLANFSHEPDQDYFAEGVTDDLTTMLGRFTDLRVAARTSAFAVAAQGLDVRQAARRLDVAYVVEGSVRRAGDRVRVNAQLIEGESGHHVWADKFDRDLQDVFAVQDEIVAQIASQVLPQLDRREVELLMTVAPERLDTWDVILRARHQLWKATPEAAAEAIQLLEAAVDRDPTSARAHAYLAGVWIEVAFQRWTVKGRNPFAEQQKAAHQAYRLDPTDPWVLSMIAAAETYAGHYDPAEELAARALARAPFDAFTLQVAGQERLYRGDHPSSIDRHTQAWSLGQHEHWRYHIAAGLSCAHYLAGNYESAWAWARRGLDLTDYVHLHALGAAALAQLGRTDEALRRLDRVRVAAPATSAGLFTRNLRWKRQEDIQHYRDGLIKAGLVDQ